MNYNRNQVDGDFAVRNNQTIGGDSTTRGDHHVIGDLHVSGAIIGSGVSSKDMGLYATESALKSAVPTPEVGMYAEVGSSFPAMLYRCDTAGTWTSTGESVTFTTPTGVAQQAMKASASALVATETTRAEFAEDTIKSLLTAETKERKASNDEIAQMLRRLSVFMSDHHHHCLDPDWLWRELLLGASLDTEKDILTLMGIQYQLTRATGSSGGGTTPTVETPNFWVGYGVQYSKVEAFTSAEQFIAIAKGSGKNSKTFNLSVDNANRDVIWILYPEGQEMHITTMQNGVNITESPSSFNLGEYEYNGETYSAEAIYMTGQATITQVTIS